MCSLPLRVNLSTKSLVLNTFDMSCSLLKCCSGVRTGKVARGQDRWEANANLTDSSGPAHWWELRICICWFRTRFDGPFFQWIYCTCCHERVIMRNHANHFEISSYKLSHLPHLAWSQKPLMQLLYREFEIEHPCILFLPHYSDDQRRFEISSHHFNRV